MRLPSTYSGTRGPGTFVVTAWHQICPADMTARNPAVIAVRTTSLTVPPNALRTALNSSNLPSVQAQRRWGPIGPLSDRAVGVTACLARDGRLCASVRPEPAIPLAAFNALLRL